MKCYFAFPENPLDHRADDVRGWIVNWKSEVLAQKPEEADVLVVAGGDGTLLEAIHELQQLEKPFFGIGRGTKNYLLNEIKSSNDISWQMSDCVSVTLSLIAVTFRTRHGDVECRAFNDVYVKATKHSGVASITVQTEYDGVFEVEGDGVIVASPQGSTAYSKNAGGAVLPLELADGHSSMWALTGIVCSSPLRHVVREQRIRMDFKYPVVGVADHEMVYDVMALDIRPSGKTATILFLPNEPFRERRRR